MSINRPYSKDVVYFIVRDWKEGKMESAMAPVTVKEKKPTVWVVLVTKNTKVGAPGGSVG